MKKSLVSLFAAAVAGVVLMMLISKKIGGGSAKYFIELQRTIGKQEGFVQETMNGQKVVKVFCHEPECIKDFEKLNNDLYESNRKAHAYANTLGPILMNIGNVLYVIIALVGGIFLVSGTPNLAISGLAFSIDIIVPFLNMTKQFTGNVIKRKGRGTVIVFQKEPDPSKGVHHGAPPNRFFPRGAFQIRLKQR